MTRATSVDELQQQIDALRRQVLEMQAKEQKEGKARASGNTVTGGATKDSFKLPGWDTSVTLGGYVKLDAVFSNPSAGIDNAADVQLNPSSIAVGAGAGDHERNQVKFGARETPPSVAVGHIRRVQALLDGALALVARAVGGPREQSERRAGQYEQGDALGAREPHLESGRQNDVGLEYIYADREAEDEQRGHLNRLQASAKYAF